MKLEVGRTCEICVYQQACNGIIKWSQAQSTHCKGSVWLGSTTPQDNESIKVDIPADKFCHSAFHVVFLSLRSFLRARSGQET